jgi:predicted TIM-barrel fold metal-dependent hydrolase
MSQVPRIIAIEEHYLDPEVEALAGAARGDAGKRMRNVASERLRDMDEAGIDMQVLSHAPPGLQHVSANQAPSVAQRANDRLAEMVAAHPTRFAAFASLPTAVPEAAAAELERCIQELGFVGAMIHGPTDGIFIDDRRFWPILERAAALGVPLYLHPSLPLPSVRDAYFGTYAKTHPSFLTAAWGFTIETGTQAMRLVLSGALEAYPNLQIILGHLGEAIPFLIARIDEALSRDTPTTNFRALFSQHFHVTTSGFFSDPALRCCIEELGVERILFAVDWPFVESRDGADWLRRLAIDDHDKALIASGNAKRLLRL